MQIEWLPGGRIEEGELIFDPAFELAEETGDPELRRLCDEKCRGFIFNFVREFGDLEYVNIGRVVGSLSHRAKTPGRRDVYIAQVKQRGIGDEIVKIIRMQKWGIREHLDDGKRLLDAIIQSEEYTEYILDRRLGCRQLGMNLPAHTTAKRISERYVGPAPRCAKRADLVAVLRARLHPRHGHRQDSRRRSWPTRRLPPAGPAAGPGGRPQHDRGTLRLAGPRGVRRRRRGGDRERGRPARRDRRGRSDGHIRRLPHRPGAFCRRICRAGQSPPAACWPIPRSSPPCTSTAFVARFSKIQLEYRKRKRAFDTLFKHRPRDEAGSFAYRWECVLDRLRRAEPQSLGNLIRGHIGARNSRR